MITHRNAKPRRLNAYVTGCPTTHDDGQQSVHCEVKFTDNGVKVEAYAFISANRAASATT